MAKKSNKTAHVLNLISSAKPVSEPKETSAQAPDDIVPQVEPSSIQNSLSQSTKNEELSEKIRDNLLAEFENHIPAEQEKHTQEADATDATQTAMDTEQTDFSLSHAETNNVDRPDHIPAESLETSDEKNLADDAEQTNHNTSLSADENILENADNTTSIHPNVNEKTETPETANIDISTSSDLEKTVSDNVTSQNIPDTANADSADSTQKETTSALDSSVPEDTLSAPPHFIFVNICEELVKEKTIEYLKRFGVCTCSRCVADTMALALTNIQPKYVVMDPDTAVPFLSYYANKLSVNVMTELTKACLTVLAHPRHDPEIAKLELEQQAKQEANQKTNPSQDSKNQ